MAEIRLACIEDEQKIQDLMEQLEETIFDSKQFHEIWIRVFDNKSMVCLVATVQGEVTGFLRMQIEDQLHHCQQTAEILELVIDQAYRGQKLGKELFLKAKEIAENYGCCVLELSSNQKRIRAHHFYEELGMTKSHVHFTMPL